MTSHPQESYRDSSGELPPPWAAFPSYEHQTIGWRMGTGESYLGWWWTFLNEKVGPSPSERLAYLKRHPAAPVSWWETVQHVWDQTVSKELEAMEGDSPEEVAAGESQRRQQRDAGLIANDVAYPTWRSKPRVPAPWHGNATPEDAARYDTRVLWFWSRALQARRDAGTALFESSPPAPWRLWEEVARSRDLPPLDPKAGLAGLALMLAAGKLIGPWDQGMMPNDAQESFDMDMNCVDAFSLLMMAAFDDQTHQAAVMRQLGLPAGPWTDWVEEQTFLDG